MTLSFRQRVDTKIRQQVLSYRRGLYAPVSLLFYVLYFSMRRDKNL